MDYEQKYREAFKKAEAFYYSATTEPITEREVLANIFQELKESEDEKIRKTIIRFFKDQYSNETEMYDGSVTVGKAVAWLEKQKKEEPSIADIVDEHFGEMLGDEKQGEQKSADKVEPKFKVGDWVIDKQGIVHEIANVVENVTTNTYGYDIVGGGYFNENTEGIRLWTISDAKDGDVLISKDKEDILIYKSYSLIDLLLTSYISFNKKEGFCPCQYSAWDSNEFIPATKEQCDTLMKAMADAGYEWNADKKELKKIEQKPITSLDMEHEVLDKVVNDCIFGNEEPAWSEEDEEISKGILNYLCLHDACELEGFDDWYEWLKDIKYRVQSKKEWSKEDERMRQYVVSDLRLLKKWVNDPKYVINVQLIEKEIEWMESIKNLKKLREE